MVLRLQTIIAICLSVNLQSIVAQHACESPCETCTDASILTCLTCAATFYMDTMSSTCQACVSPCETCTDESTCLTCASTFYMDTTSRTCKDCVWPCETCTDPSTCLSCASTFYWDTLSSTCQACVSPCEECIAESTCVTCASNFYMDTTSSTCQAGEPCPQEVQTLTPESGTLRSPNYPRSYPNWADCQWRISASSASGAVQLYVYALSTESCCDFVRIYDGFDSKAPQLGSLSGSWARIITYSTTQRHMYITFTSDRSVVSSGFSASYYTTGKQCSPNVETLTSERGILRSPYYPSSYTDGVTCHWRISASPPSGAVRLLFGSLSTQSCCDFVKVYDGFDSTAPLLASLSGISYSASGYSTTQPHMYITFTSDGSTVSSGFTASYSTFPYTTTTSIPIVVTCSQNVQNLTSERGTLTSPNYPSSYSNLATCQWRISAYFASGSVRLMFNAMSTEYFCDFVRIYDGFDSTAPLIASLSGWLVHVNGYSTTQRHMYITFTSDGSSVSSGFSASYSMFQYTTTTFTPGETCSPNVKTLTSERGKLTSPNYPSSYPNDAVCQWRISASSASGAVRFDLDTLSTELWSDFVMLYDGFNSNAPLLVALSGSSYSTNGYSTTQRYMYIVFRSNYIYVSTGFSASYSTFQYTPPSQMGSWLAPTVVASVLAFVLIVMISCIVHRRRRNRFSSRSRPPGVEPQQSSLISTPVAPPYDSPSNANDPITFILPPPSYDSAVNACSGQPVAPIPEFTAVQFISRYPADNIETTDVNDNSQPLQQSLSLSTSSLSIPPLTAAPAPSDLAR